MATAVSPPRATRPGTMVLAQLPTGHDTELVRADGRLKPEVRAALRRIPSWRNAWSVLWLLVLRKVPLNLAYPFVALAFIFVPVLGHYLLGEPLRLQSLLGAALIGLGVWVSVR